MTKLSLKKNRSGTIYPIPGEVMGFLLEPVV